MKTKKGSRLLAIAMAVMMVFAMAPLIPGHSEAHGVNGDPAIVMGTNALAKNANFGMNPQVVWYGGEDWYVIAHNGKDGEGKVIKYTDPSGDAVALHKKGVVTLLMKSMSYYSGSQGVCFNEDNTSENSNAYHGSNLEAVVNSFLVGGERALFTSAEQDAIKARTLEGGTTNRLDNDPSGNFDPNKIKGDSVTALLWIPSMAEALAMPRTIRVVGTKSWWLRSPGSGNGFATAVGSSETISNASVKYTDYGARAALDLNQKSVIMASAAEGGKVGSTYFTKVGTNSGNEWKLTLRDSAHDNFSVTKVKSASGGGLSVFYRGAVAGDNEYISGIIVNSAGEVTYYGRLYAASSAYGSQITIHPEGMWNPDEGDRLYIFNEQYNGDKKTDYASDLFEIEASALEDEGSLQGSGTAEDPYVISSSQGWEALSKFVAEGNATEGKYFKLNANVNADANVTSDYMVGTSEHPFSGIFDGNGHTVKFNTSSWDPCAPFQYTKNATFLNLKVKGTINARGKFAAGIAANAAGETLVKNCKSSINIISTVSGDGTHGGLIANANKAIFEGCTFDGKITGENTTLCAGFLGWDASGGGSDCINCVFDGTIKTASDSANFIRNTDKATNSYYMSAIGQSRERGKQAREITADSGIAVDFGKGTSYDVSGITAYQTGVEYEGSFYAGKDDVVSLTMQDLTANNKQYVVNHGTLTSSGNQHQITMPDRDVNISLVPIKLLDPTNVTLDVCTSEAGRITEVDACWHEVADADGYDLTLYKIENGKWTQIGDTIKVSKDRAYNGKFYYELNEDLSWDNIGSGGVFSFKVQAYGAGGVKSGVVAADNTVEIYSMELIMGYMGDGFFVLGGSYISELIEEQFYMKDESDSYYIGDDNNYYCKIEGTPYKIICFIDKSPYDYSSLAELKKDAVFVPGQLSNNYRVTKNIEVMAFDESNLCEKTGDLHKWETTVIEPATETDSGELKYTCSDCGAEKTGYIPRIEGFALAKNTYVYTGKALKPKVTVMNIWEEPLKEGVDYKVTYKNNTNVGTASAVVTLIGAYTGTKTLTFKITKAANTMKVKGKTATVKYTKVKKKVQTLKRSAVISLTGAKGTVTYVKSSGNKKITISKAGKVTVKKGLKKGTYKVKVKVKAAGNTNYKALTKIVTFTIKVK